MNIVQPSYEILGIFPGEEDCLQWLERIGRTCYSPDTEVLTDFGWVRLDQCSEDAQVLTFDRHSALLRYEPINLVCMHYAGKMVTCTRHNSVEFMVTPDHRMLVSKPHDTMRSGYRFVPASGLCQTKRNRGFRIPKWFDKSRLHNNLPKAPRTIEMRAVEYQSGRERKTKRSVPGITVPVNTAFITMLASFVAEGHIVSPKGSGAGITITQREDSPLYNLVLSALKKLRLSYNITEDPRKPEVKRIKVNGGKPLAGWFSSNCGKGSKNKRLPEWFRRLPPRLLRHLLDVLYMGDGSGNTTRTEKYLSISPVLLDQVQEIHVLLGRNASLGEMNHASWASPCGYVEESQRDSWVIRPDHIDLVDYSGWVYCPSTSAGVVCVRRNRKAIWCGNCYKSEDKITAESAPKFVRGILKLGRLDALETRVYDLVMDAIDQHHADKSVESIMQAVKDMLADPPHESVIEHSMMTVRFIFDRGISHEDVRHRICAFSQESTRYCNYGKGDGGINVIEVPFWDKDDPNDQLYAAWEEAMLNADQSYRHLISLGAKPQEARSVLPNSLKTELVHTANFREWRHIFRLRTSKRAHPQMREVVVPLLRELKAKPNLGLLFEDIPDPEDV